MFHVQNRELVVPGQLLAEGDYQLRGGSFHEGKNIYASVVGLASFSGNSVRVIPLQGRYIPMRGDHVIGIVIDSHHSGWVLDLNSPYTGNLFVSDLLGRKVDLIKEDIHKYLKIGDTVIAEVKDVDERMRVQLACRRGMGKIKGGKLVELSPTKIPRVIGKKGSMANIIQQVGNCRLEIGQNGRIVIIGKNERGINAVVEALLTIEREAHTTGLTDRIKLMLEEASRRN